MKIKLKILALILFMSTSMMAQKYVTKNGHISFYSSTPVEDILAHNNLVNAALDAKTGDFVFKVLIKSFQFEKALMQEHFNENYMESDEFPNSTFQGKVVNLSDVDFATNGTYNVEIEGKLTIHGVTRDVKEQGSFVVSENGIAGNSKFDVKVKDYDIKIPNTVINKISETIEVTVNVELTPIK